VVVAGGMESMTNAPYLLPKARGGYRIGHDRIFDHMMLDGLEDAYDRAAPWAPSAKTAPPSTASPRAEQDAFATASVQRAKAATETGASLAEIAPVTVKGQGRHRGRHRRRPGQGQARQDPHAQARVQEGRHHHRRQQLSINDGAAALVMMRASHRRQAGLQAAGAHRQPRRARAGA
jgi:acetyl-CoA C-acetyltransferase